MAYVEERIDSKNIRQNGYQQKGRYTMVEAYNDLIIETLANGESVPLKGFGTFTKTVRKSRAKGEAEKEVVSLRFTPSKKMKDALKGGRKD